MQNFREWLRESEKDPKVKVSSKLNKIEINNMQYSPAAAIEKYIELTKCSVEEAFKKLKISEFINKKTNNKYTISDFKYLNESADVYDSEYKSDMILKLNKSAKLGDNLIYYEDENGPKINNDMYVVYKESNGLTMFNTKSGVLTSYTKGKKVDMYVDSKVLKKLI